MLCVWSVWAKEQTNRQSTGIHTFAAQSLLANDRWVRIAVEHTGVYQLRDADLRRMGFSHPAQVGVYGFGGNMLDESLAQPHIDDLPEVAVWRDEAGKRTLFYARGLVRWKMRKDGSFEHENNPYATQACYFLRQKQEAPKALAAIESMAHSDTLVCHFDNYALHEQDLINVGNTGREMYGESFVYTQAQSFQVPTPKMIAQKGLLEVNFMANSPTTGARLKAQLARGVSFDKAVPSLGGNKYRLGQPVHMKESFMAQAESEIDVTLVYSPNGVQPKEARLNYIRVNYASGLTHTDYFYGFRSHYAQNKAITYAFDSPGHDLQVWDVSDATDHRLQQVQTVAGKMQFTTRGLREYVVVNTKSVYPNVEQVEVMRNQNLHALPQTDMVIVSPVGLLAQAERLADYRRSNDSLHVTVVTPQPIYNEFSSGTPDVTAIRLFMKMFYDRAAKQGDMEKAPRYLLLFGDGANDNRGMNKGMWKSDVLKNCLLTYQSEPSLDETNSYVCDDYFGFLDDNEGGYVNTSGELTLARDVLDLGIGRLPVRNITQARQVVDKIIHYSENKVVGSWKNQLCFLGDDGDYNTHMRHAEDMVELLEKDGQLEFNYSKIYLDAYKREMTASGLAYPAARKQFLDQLQQGALLVNYSGHGSTTSITHERLFMLADAETLSMRRLPVWVTATCDFSRFDHASTSAGEALLLNPQGGGIALFTTTRVVYSDGNHNLNSRLIEHLFQKNADGTRLRMGDVMKLSKRSLGFESNKLNFSLLGDPSMYIAYPEFRMRITHLNGELIGENMPTIKALSEVRFRGEVLAVGTDEVATGFNGMVYPTVFDSEDEITAMDNDQTGSPLVFKSRNKRLFAGCDSVKNGVFEFSFIVPKDISYANQKGMLNLYAHDENGNESQGYFNDFLVGGTADDVMTDTIGPRITALYLNNDRFQAGDVVNATPYLIASLEDESGINATGAAIGHDLVATIIAEQGEPIRYVINTYFQTQAGESSHGMVRFSIPELAEGSYRLQLKAWDLFNNSSQKEIHFEVKHSVKPVIYDLRAKMNPVREQAEFLLTHDKPESKLQVRLQVYTQMGQCVWQEDMTGSSDYMTDLPIVWDLHTPAGQRVQPGIYIYRAAISCDGEHYATKSKKLVVLAQ